MQHERRVGLEPPNVVGTAAAGDHGEPRRHVTVETRQVDVGLQQFGIPEQRKVVENDVVWRERHVVGQSRAWQRHVDVVHQLVVLVDHPVVHVGRLLAVVEEQQFAGGVVDLGVRRHSPLERERALPVRLAKGVAGIRVNPVQVAALVEAGQGRTAVHDHVGAGGILHQCPCAPAFVALGDLHRFGQAWPQRSARLVLCGKSVGTNEPVAVEGFPVAEPHDVHHAVAVERMVELERRVQWVLGVAQVDAVQVAWDLALDGGQAVGVPFGGLRAPRTRAVGVVVVLGQGGEELPDDLDIHGQTPLTTKLTVVAVLPPKLSVPNVFAPST